MILASHQPECVSTLRSKWPTMYRGHLPGQPQATRNRPARDRGQRHCGSGRQARRVALKPTWCSSAWIRAAVRLNWVSRPPRKGLPSESLPARALGQVEGRRPSQYPAACRKPAILLEVAGPADSSVRSERPLNSAGPGNGPAGLGSGAGPRPIELSGNRAALKPPPNLTAEARACRPPCFQAVVAQQLGWLLDDRPLALSACSLLLLHLASRLGAPTVRALCRRLNCLANMSLNTWKRGADRARPGRRRCTVAHGGTDFAIELGVFLGDLPHFGGLLGVDGRCGPEAPRNGQLLVLQLIGPCLQAGVGSGGWMTVAAGNAESTFLAARAARRSSAARPAQAAWG